MISSKTTKPFGRIVHLFPPRSRRPDQREFNAMLKRRRKEFSKILSEYQNGGHLEDFGNRFNAVLHEAHTQAWKLGRQRAGDLRKEHFDDTLAGIVGKDKDRDYLRKFMLEIGDGKYGKGEGLQVAKIKSRADLYIGRARGTANEAFVATMPNTTVYVWTLGGAERHCFPGGTPILTPTGSRKIALLQVGDWVCTRHGNRRITKVFTHSYSGQMVRVGGIDATGNHPFWTTRGWVTAECLKPGDMLMRVKDRLNICGVKVGLPNTADGVTAFEQVAIHRRISLALLLLAFGKRFKAWMPVPIFAVALNDKATNANIDNEMRFHNKRRFKLNAEAHQQNMQFAFSTAGVSAVGSLSPLGHGGVNSFRNIGVVAPPLGDLTTHKSIFHRVMFSHVPSSLPMNELPVGIGIQPQSEAMGAILDTTDTQAQFGAKGGPLRCIARFQDFIQSRGPRWLSAWWLRGMGNAVSGMPIAHMPASGTNLALDHAVLPRVGRVSAKSRAINPFATFVAMLQERLGANRACRSVTHGIHFTRKPVKVFNLEIEGEHEYIAGGFVVHNCEDCPSIAAGSPYTKDTLYVTPGIGGTPCLSRCKCFLVAHTQAGSKVTGFRSP